MRLYFTIGEPWNFESSDGKNRLHGSASMDGFGTVIGREYLIAQCIPFESDNGEEVTNLLILARLSGTALKNDLLSKKTCYVVAAWLPLNEAWTHEQANIVIASNKKSDFLIGSVWLGNEEV